MSARVRPRGLPLAPRCSGVVKPPAARPNITLIALPSAFATAMSGTPSLLRSPAAMSKGPPGSAMKDSVKPPPDARRFSSTATPCGPSFAVAMSTHASRSKSATVMPRAPGDDANSSRAIDNG